MDCMTGLDSDSFCSLLVSFVKRQSSDVPYSAIFGDVTLAFWLAYINQHLPLELGMHRAIFRRERI